MAVQFHVAFSKDVNGAAIFAGGPFYCAESTIHYAEKRCMDTTAGLPEVDKLVALTRADAYSGLVDDPDKHMQNDKVYLFSGTKDSVVAPEVVASLLTYYEAFIPASNITTVFDFSAEHCLPTLDYGEDCETKSSPYIGDCNFDGAG